MAKLTKSLVLALLSTTVVVGGGFDGAISSSAYLFSRQNGNEDQETHFRMHESFRLRYQPRFQKNLQFTASGVFYFDPVAPAEEGDPAFNLYALNASYRRLFKLFDLDAGRIFVYDPSNSGRIDGLSIKGSLPLRIHYLVYGGGFVFADGEFSNPLKDHLLGLNLTIPVRSKTRVSVAISQKAHHRESYRNGGGTRKVPNVAERRLGIRLNMSFGSWSILVRAVEDLHWMNTQEINVVTAYSKRPFQRISLEYYFRRPRVYYNSIFSVFDAQTNQELAASGTYMLKSNWRLFSKARLILFSGTQSFVFNVGTGWRHVSAQYQYQQGYGGDFHRVIVNGRYRLLSRLLLRGSLNLGNYKPLEESWENIGTVMAGMTYQWTKLFSISADVHSLQNRYYDKDNRLFIRVNYILP